MPAYTIRGVQADGTTAPVSTAESARIARTDYATALEQFERVIVTDADGREVDAVELHRLAAEEGDGS